MRSAKIEHVPFAVLMVMLAACFLMGGASRNDVASLIILQPLAAACSALLLMLPGTRDWRAVRTPLLLLGGLAALMVVQLIPLPPTLWAALPGHGLFAQTARSVDLQLVWRPMSVTPDLTLASLTGLAVPFAVLISYACIHGHQRHALLAVIITGSAASALLGLAQVSGGVGSPFYTYAVTNHGSAVGLFSNRNHQAVLLAMTLPMLAAWTLMRRRNAQRDAVVRWVALGFGLFLLPLMLVIGSRAGLVLGVLGLAGAGLIWRANPKEQEASRRRRERVMLLVALTLAALVFLATVLLSRAESIQRLLKLDAGEDPRVEATPVALVMARDFFPIGSGFGSFDPVFRHYEPVSMIDPTYFNHAHNDVLELVITAGLPGVVLATILIVWVAGQAVRAWRSSDLWVDIALARVASLIILIAAASSAVDYPLRTPLMMAIIAIACAWLGSVRPQADQDEEPD